MPVHATRQLTPQGEFGLRLPKGIVCTPRRESCRSGEGWSLFPPSFAGMLEDGAELSYNTYSYLRDPQGFVFFKPGLG